MIDLQRDFTNRLLSQLRGILSALLGIEQKINSINENYESEKEARNKPFAVTATLATPETISVKAETEERNNPWKVALTAFQIIGITTAISYAVVTYFMWKEMMRSSNSAELSIEESRKSRQRSEQAFVSQEHDTTTQLGLIRKQNKAAQAGVDAISRQMRLDQRPWIRITDDQIALSPNQPVTASIYLTNTGKTPALDVIAIFMLDKVAGGHSPDWYWFILKMNQCRFSSTLDSYQKKTCFQAENNFPNARWIDCSQPGRQAKPSGGRMGR